MYVRPFKLNYTGTSANSESNFLLYYTYIKKINFTRNAVHSQTRNIRERSALLTVGRHCIRPTTSSRPLPSSQSQYEQGQGSPVKISHCRTNDQIQRVPVDQRSYSTARGPS